MGRDRDGSRDVDSAGVYFMTVDEFEGRESGSSDSAARESDGEDDTAG